MWPKEGREWQTAEAVVTLEEALEAASSRSAGSAAVHAWKTEIVGEERKMDLLNSMAFGVYSGASHLFGWEANPDQSPGL